MRFAEEKKEKEKISLSFKMSNRCKPGKEQNVKRVPVCSRSAEMGAMAATDELGEETQISALQQTEMQSAKEGG